MITKMMIAKGNLTPTNRSAVDDNTAETLKDIAHRVALWLLIEEGNRLNADGTIEITSSIETNESHHTILAWVNRLNVFLEQAEIAALRLSGQLMITVDTTDEPFVMRVTVREGKVFYQDAHITWSTEVPF